eukprot:m.844400 g.844400  ORF g.844400 m.844400 type:complete len:71 (-) comp59544_c0_seq5:2351-2563(-)
MHENVDDCIKVVLTATDDPKFLQDAPDGDPSKQAHPKCGEKRTLAAATTKGLSSEISLSRSQETFGSLLV